MIALTKIPFGEISKHMLLILGAIIVLIPFYVMATYSLKSQGEIERNDGGIFGAQAPMVDSRCAKRLEPDPQMVKAARPRFQGVGDKAIRVKLLEEVQEQCTTTPAVYNYTTAFKEAPLLRYLLNGAIVTLSIFFIQVLVALPASYALSKLKFWGKNFVFALVLFCLLIPVHAIALPLYIMLAKLGLTNSYTALIAPWTISVFGIFLYNLCCTLSTFFIVALSLYERYVYRETL